MKEQGRRERLRVEDKLKTNQDRVRELGLRTVIKKADPVDSPCLLTSNDKGWGLMHCKKITNNDHECTLAVGKGCMKKVETRGGELLGGEKRQGKRTGRTRQRISANMNQEDRRGDECDKHTLEFVLQLEAKTDASVLWPRMNENQRSKKNKDNNPLHCWVCEGRLE